MLSLQLLAKKLHEDAVKERKRASFYRAKIESTEFPDMFRISAANSERLAEKLERLAAAAERGEWPPGWANLCAHCRGECDDPEDGRCSECKHVDCCGPTPSWAVQCDLCYEYYCPHCGRWIPDCQRGL